MLKELCAKEEKMQKCTLVLLIRLVLTRFFRYSHCFEIAAILEGSVQPGQNFSGLSLATGKK